MNSWWELGDWRGFRGNDLAVHEIVCPFCHERGNFSFAHRADKKKPNASKVLHFDTLKCGSCAGYVMVLWSTSHFGGGLHDFRTLPWPLRREKIPGIRLAGDSSTNTGRNSRNGLGTLEVPNGNGAVNCIGSIGASPLRVTIPAWVGRS